MSGHLPILDATARFPNGSSPLYKPKTPDGLCFIGGNLQPDNLLRAYCNGVFPWSADPLTWWSPTPRAIFELGRIRVPRRLAQVVRTGKFSITYDTCFRSVMEGCAALTAKRPETWISPEFIEAYCSLHGQGYAHSCEVWLGGQMVGGVYGVAIGGFFVGESMFSRIPYASSVGLVDLFERLRAAGFQLFDTQVANAHTLRLGAVEIPREDYLLRLECALRATCRFPSKTSEPTGCRNAL